MRYAVEYELYTGTIGLCLFSANDQQAAEKYVADMPVKYGYYATRNLQEIPMGASMNVLYELYPGINKRTRDEWWRKGVTKLRKS